MDAIVLQAMAKWPNVPAVFGWLSLSARGQYLLKGESIGNVALRDFIARNYAGDAAGNWFFQNGPQRVYVALQVAPWVYRIDGAGQLATHIGGRVVELRRVWADDGARLYFDTEFGPGAIDDRDTAQFAACLTDGDGKALDDEALTRWCGKEEEAFFNPTALLPAQRKLMRIERTSAESLPDLLGYVREPSVDTIEH